MYVSVLQDFCKLALDYIQKGPNLKLYSAAARIYLIYNKN